MNWKLAILVGIATYIVSFVAGVAVAGLLGIDVFGGEEVGATLWIVNILVGIVIIGAISWWFFNKEKPTLQNGLYLGLVFFGVGLLLDSALILPTILIAGAPVDILAYYIDPFFWIAVGAIIATPVVIGWYRGKN